MITATFYKNGFLIKDHARPDICGELSMFTFTVANIMLNLDRHGEYVAKDDSGYGHFIFRHEVPELANIFSLAKQMLPVWAEKWWEGQVQIIEKDELLILAECHQVD